MSSRTSVLNSRRNSFHLSDSGGSQAPGTNPFTTPGLSRTASRDEKRPYSYFPPVSGVHVPRRRKFKSARYDGTEYEKPWMSIPNPRRKWERIIFWGSIGLGVALGGFICYLSLGSVANHEVCVDDSPSRYFLLTL